MAALNTIEALADDVAASRKYSPFTVTIASPAVFTADNHGLWTNDRVKLYTTGALPTGLSGDTYYYVIYATEHTFKVSATRDGSAIDTSGSQSGSHYFSSDLPQRMVGGYQNNE